MRRNSKSVWLVVIALALGWGLVSGSVRAQQPPMAPPPPPGPDVFFNEPLPGPEPGALADSVMFFVGFEAGIGGNTMAGAPFSATFSTQTTQAFADGNKIERTTTGKLARDSQGRTRREMTLPGIGPWAPSGKTAPHVVFINDPVAGTNYVLQPDQKIARKMPGFPHGGHHGGNWAAGQPVLPPELPGMEGEASFVMASLGTQTVNGVLAEGTRHTRTIAAGAIGNEKPIVITSERWFSTDLQTVVLTKRSDPRTGETVSQLTDIQRSEPDSTLFQVPSDYTVKQGGPNVRFRGNRLEQ